MKIFHGGQLCSTANLCGNVLRHKDAVIQPDIETSLWLSMCPHYLEVPHTCFGRSFLTETLSRESWLTLLGRTG